MVQSDDLRPPSRSPTRQPTEPHAPGEEPTGEPDANGLSVEKAAKRSRSRTPFKMLQRMGDKVRGRSKAKEVSAIADGAEAEAELVKAGDKHYSRNVVDEGKRDKTVEPATKKKKSTAADGKEKVKQTVIVQAPGEDVNDDTYEMTQMLDQV